MHTLSSRLVMAAFALMLILAACASDTGATWTYAPVSAGAAESPSGAAESPAGAAESPAGPAASSVASSEAPGGHADMSMAPGEPTEAAPAESAAPPSGEGRVIELVATAALQFTTPDGTQVTDIPVSPGETVVFRIDNTAGFDHNFYIGTDAELSVPGATTPTGIPMWQSGVQELTWVVPEDITGLKFGCTVPGHYALMQGTFSAAA